MRLAPYLAFFLSGASSLIFQMIWSRMLHHVFGSSSVAISSVVSIFMGGLGLGAFLFGRYADRIRKPLQLYAWAELGVAVFALAVPWLVRPDGWLAWVNAALRHQLGAESGAFMVARFLCIVPVLIVPTTLMGSTLPLLSRHFVSSSERADSASARVGTLYAVNTAGAVIGVLLAGFVLMPNFGVRAANFTAVGMNLSLAALIFALSRYLPAAAGAAATRRPANDASEAPVELPAQAPYPRSIRLVAALCFAVSGLCSLAYEVVWSRALINTIGASVYAFALILMTFLVGIAGGSAIASHLATRARGQLGGLALVAALTTPVALLPLAIRHGLVAYAASSGLALAAIGLSLRTGRKRVQQLALLDADATQNSGAGHGGAPLLLALPATTALVVAVYDQSRLGWILLAVVLSVTALLLVLTLLRGRDLLLLAACQLYIAAATFVSDLFADEISLTFASMVVPLYEALGEHVDRVMALMFVTSGLCVLPSALGMGAIFPLTLRVFSAGGERIGREVSLVYSGNTVGSIVGAWLPGFVLMPALGMQATLHAAMALNLLMALALVLVAAGAAAGASAERRAAFLLAPAVPALIALLYVLTAAGSPLTWNLTRMTLGVFRISLARDVLDAEAWGEPDLVYYHDGLSTTVSVERWGRHYSLKNNGKVEASNGDDMPTQIMVSALPLMLHPAGPRDLQVAIVGLGSGVTVGAALQFPLGHADVMELERSVVDASRFFADVNHLQYTLPDYPYIEEPRLTLHNDDGRNFLAASDQSYDVIISEPSNPWITGVSDLFTVDHFRVAKTRLAKDGIYCQWVQLYEMSPRNVKIIYRTFASQFKHVVVFSAEDLSSDTILMGSDSPLPLDLGRLRRAFAEPGVIAELERAYIHSPYDVLARVLLSDRDEVMRFTQIEYRKDKKTGRVKAIPEATNAEACQPPGCRREPLPLNTDDNALIEFAAPRDLIGFERYRGYLRTVYHHEWPYGRLQDKLIGPNWQPEDVAEQAIALLAHGRTREAGALVAMLPAAPTGGLRAKAETKPGAASASPIEQAHAIWGVLGDKPNTPKVSFPAPKPEQLDPELDAGTKRQLSRGHAEALDWLRRGEPKRAVTALSALPSALLQHAGAPMGYLRGYLHYRAGQYDEAIDTLEATLQADPAFTLEHPALYFFLARAHDALMHFDKAVRNAQVYIEAAPLWAGGADDEALPEPPANNAPISDEAGETLKEFHADRGGALAESSGGP